MSYNQHYTYDDLYLWQDAAYEHSATEAAPVFMKLRELWLEKNAAGGFTKAFAGREDLQTDEVNRVAYFPDVLAEWETKGMHFTSSGMMGISMAPEKIYRHEIYDAPVLYIPYVIDDDEPEQAMNLLSQNAELLEEAAQENVLVQFADCFSATHGSVIEKIIESQGTFRTSYHPIYLDISLLKEAGLSLADVEGIKIEEWAEPVTLLGRWCVDISDKLELRQAHQHSISNIYHWKVPEWNFDKHIRSLAGKRQAESMHLEYDFKSTDDPRMEAFFKERGIRLDNHFLGHDWYLTLTPESAMEHPEEKIPLLIVMKEPRTACRISTQTAFQFYYDFIEICARGEFMMLFFALETPEDNDEVLPGVLREVMAQYPVDETRVYLTGQSHNGYYALEFYRRHPNLIAAAATLCDPVGLKVGAVIDYYKTRATEIIDSFRQHDFPLIDINGNLENSYARKDRSPETIEEDVFYFENRMKAFRLHEFSKEEILSVHNSADRATAMNGVPSDRSEVRYMMGDEVYVSDYFNEKGELTFRYASIENTPHMIMPQMADLSWEFLRRFTRNPETGESGRLY